MSLAVEKILPDTAECVGEDAAVLRDGAGPRRRRAHVLPALHLRDVAPAGRPPGEVTQALLDALQRLTTPTRAPTQLELAAAARVGRLATKHTVENLVRAGRLQIVRRRWVSYRRSPVAEYALAEAAPAEDARAHLVRCMAGFVR